MKPDDIHVMIDLETMGNKAGAPVLEIGAVACTEERGIYSNFGARVSLKDCMACGLKPDAGTIEWWLTQSEEARLALAKPGVEPLTLREALARFSRWFTAEVSAGRKASVWGKGASFDPVLLRAAYDAVGMEHPWPYWMERCHRTIVAEWPEVKEPEFEGVKHSGLADARHQALHLLRILRKRRSLLTARAANESGPQDGAVQIQPWG